MTDAPPAPDGPEAAYGAREARFRGERDAHDRRADRLGNARLFAFTAGLLSLLLAANADGAEATPFWVLAGVALLAFAGLVAVHRRVRARRRFAEALRAIAAAALARRRRDWEALRVPEPDEPSADHPYAADLDVLGRASLLHLTDATGTEVGRRTLTERLLAPALPEEVRARQEAVTDLAPRLDWRDELAAEGRLAAEPGREALERFLSWASSEPWLRPKAWLRAAAWGVPAATLTLAALQVAGVLDRHWWLLSVGAAVGLSAWTGRAVKDHLEAAAAGEPGAGAYAPLFRRLESVEVEAPLLKRLQAELGGEAAAALARLAALGRLADVRFAMLHFLFQYLLLWDLHVLAALERWQISSGARAQDWIRVLGEADALMALAALAHAHPDWAFPETPPGHEEDEDGGAVLEARELRHPLLPPEEAVANDVRVGPPGSFLLVTGANMSGKTTLLRAVGTNVVLAQAGAPVAAATFRAPPLDVWTAMRIDDSLVEGVSLFLAELRRLKAIVDAAADARGRPAGEARPAQSGGQGRRVLYLLDEVLRGTNPEERREGARRVLRLLTRTGAIGAVSTHDLRMAEAEDLAAAARTVHLTGGPGGGLDEADFRLRPGPAPSRNALALMDRMGLRDPEVPDP